MRVLVALIAGSIFGTGLMLSGMTDTTKVQGWLDLLGTWDPTLAFVLGGAVIPMLVTWRIAAARKHAVLGGEFPATTNQVIDRDLIVGSGLFGVGWAMVGLCPGPAMASLSYGGLNGMIFFAAMAVGMIGLRQVRQAVAI